MNHSDDLRRRGVEEFKIRAIEQARRAAMKRAEQERLQRMKEGLRSLFERPVK